MSDNFGSSTGEWLYVKVLFDGQSISHVSFVNFGVSVLVAEHRKWFAGAEWDSAGDPILNVNTSIAKGDCDFISKGNSSTYNITVTEAGNGSVSPSGTVPVNEGANKKFTFTPQLFSEVESVQYATVNGEWKSVGAVSSHTFYNVQEDMKLDVKFSEGTATKKYWISVSKQGTGTISPDGQVSVVAGGSKTFQFSPPENVKYMTFGPIGAADQKTKLDGPLSSYTFKDVQESMELGVVFTEVDDPTYFMITVKTDGSGTVSPPGPVSVVAGSDSERFYFTPASGWEIEDVGFGPSSDAITFIGARDTYAFTNVQENKVLSVVFVEINGTTTSFEADETFPVYQIPVAKGEILKFEPVLEFANYPGDLVNYYVAYYDPKMLFLARKELTGNIIFERYYSDSFWKCGTYDFGGGYVWECDILKRANLQTDLVADQELEFILLVAPGEDLTSSQGARFKFYIEQ